MIQQTSIEAYIESQKQPMLGSKQERILKVIKDYPDGISNGELAHATGWPINQVTPRVHELREKGLVFEKEKRMCLMTKRKVIAWASK